MLPQVEVQQQLLSEALQRTAEAEALSATLSGAMGETEEQVQQAEQRLEQLAVERAQQEQILADAAARAAEEEQRSASLYVKG